MPLLELFKNTEALMVISCFWALLPSSSPSQSSLCFIYPIAKKAFTVTLWGHGPLGLSGEACRCLLSLRFLEGVELQFSNRSSIKHQSIVTHRLLIGAFRNAIGQGLWHGTVEVGMRKLAFLITPLMSHEKKYLWLHW